MISRLVPIAPKALSTLLLPEYSQKVLVTRVQWSLRIYKVLEGLMQAGFSEQVHWSWRAGQYVTACSDGARKEQNHGCITDHDQNRMIWAILRLALL